MSTKTLALVQAKTGSLVSLAPGSPPCAKFLIYEKEGGRAWYILITWLDVVGRGRLRLRTATTIAGYDSAVFRWPTRSCEQSTIQRSLC